MSVSVTSAKRKKDQKILCASVLLKKSIKQNVLFPYSEQTPVYLKSSKPSSLYNGYPLEPICKCFHLSDIKRCHLFQLSVYNTWEKSVPNRELLLAKVCIILRNQELNTFFKEMLLFGPQHLQSAFFTIT